jgi:hypothetical protein
MFVHVRDHTANRLRFPGTLDSVRVMRNQMTQAASGIHTAKCLRCGRTLLAARMVSTGKVA